MKIKNVLIVIGATSLAISVTALFFAFMDHSHAVNGLQTKCVDICHEKQSAWVGVTKDGNGYNCLCYEAKGEKSDGTKD